MVFSPYGNLWTVTAHGRWHEQKHDLRGNLVVYIPTEGPGTGHAFRSAVGPVFSP